MFFASSKFAEAYRATDYIVRNRGREVVIRIGTTNRAVDRLLGKHKSRTATFVTASNPSSKQCGAVANAGAHRLLVAALKSRKAKLLEGEGHSQNGIWPPERSVLAFGLDQRAATAIVRRFRQNAIVFVECGRPARLLELR